MKRIVVGVDGSAASSAALVWTAQIATKSGAEILAVNCFERPQAESYPEDYNRPLRDRELALEQWVTPAKELGAEVRAVVEHGDPREVLLDIAKDADLLVLGRAGTSGGPGFLHLGSVAEYAAHHTRTPLAVIPSGWTDPIKRIVVGVEGSPASLAGIFWISKIAPALGASVIAVQVQEPYLEWTPSTSHSNWRYDVELLLEKWTSSLTALGVPVEVVAQHDMYPADGLLGVAATRKADLLLVGTRGVGGFTGLRVGGVALKVLHRATLPLVMVPVE